MKFILSIILFIGYWFVLAILLMIFLPYFIDEEKATNISMFLAVPLSIFLTKKTLNKIFLRKDIEVNTQNEAQEEDIKEEKQEKEYSYISPPEKEKSKEETKAKTPREKYKEKLKKQGKSPTPEANKLEQEKIKKRVLENIKKFREETYKDEKNTITLEIELSMPKTVKKETSQNKKTTPKENIEEPNLVLPYIIEIEDQPIIKLIHKNDLPEDIGGIIKMLWEEGYLFNSQKWELSKFERERIYKRINQYPFPDKYDIQRMIEGIRKEKYTIFLSEEFLKTHPKYVIAHFIKDITVTLYEEKGTGVEVEEELLEIVNNQITKPILKKDPDLHQFLTEMKKVVNPTPRQRIKGMDRVNKHWNLVLYSIQLEELQKEIMLLQTNALNFEKYKNIQEYWLDNDFFDGIRVDFFPEAYFFDIGFGENKLPSYVFPVAINPNIRFSMEIVLK